MDNMKLLQQDQPAAAEPAPAEPVAAAPAEPQQMQPMDQEAEEPAAAEPEAAAPAEPEAAAPAEPEAAAPAEPEAAEPEAAAGQEGNQPAQAEDPQEEEEEKEEQAENPPEQADQAQNPQNAAQDGELASDDINQEIMAVAQEAGVENENPEEEGGDPDRAFDTLDDLKKLGGDQDKAGGEGDDKDTSERAVNDRKAVMQMRKGNLYKAVIYAKMLENGQNPAEEAKAVDAKQPGGGGRFDRFLNSSKLDKAGKIVKTANAASGLMAMADSNYKGSKINGLIGKANDILILINSVRGIIKKLRAFKQNSTSTRKKAFAVIGLVSDFSMAISKGASLLQGFANRRGWGKLAGLLGQLSSLAGMVGQVSALTSVCNTLLELTDRHATIRKAQKAEEPGVTAILQKYGGSEGAEGAAQPENAEQGKAKKEPKKRRRLIKKKIPKEQILRVMERPDVSEEDKAVLATYLAREKMLSKSKLAMANVSTGMITASIGLGASLFKSEAKHTKGNAQKAALTAATHAGALTNVSMLLSTAGMHIAGKHVNKTDERETGLIREGLWGAVHGLTDDKFGLRKIAATLEPANPDKGHMQEAEFAVKRYETASKQLAGSGVNFAKLFAANDLETFKNSLVAGM